MTALSAQPGFAAVAPYADTAKRAAAWIRVTFLVCVAIQVWLISAGQWTSWPGNTARYDLLARAFAQGRTHLPVNVDPRHLDLADPYDPVANRVLRHDDDLHDTCLYNGKFYLYWGPLPALMLVPIKAIAGDATVIGDQYLCFAFILGIMWISSLLLLEIRARYFPKSPAWLPAMGLAVASLSTPITCIVTRAAVYEGAIVGGQFFLLAGIYLAWRSLRSRTESADAHKPIRHGLTLFGAGFCLAAAVACRVSLAIAVAAIGLMVVINVFRSLRRHPAAMLVGLTTFALPLVATALSLGWYNHIRFGQWHQFGQKYQLSGANLRAIPSLFSLNNLWPGLWSYFLRPMALVDHFPWLVAVPGDGQFPAFIALPPHYESFERITGLLWVMPFLWLLPVVGGVALIRKALTTYRRSKVVESTDATTKPVRAWLGWLMASLVIAAVLGFGPVLMMMGSAQRYLADFTPPLVIVAVVVLWMWTDASRATRLQTRLRLTVATSLAAVTVLVGFLVSIEGYGGQFRFNNPQLFQQLSGQSIQDPSHADQ